MLAFRHNESHPNVAAFTRLVSTGNSPSVFFVNRKCKKTIYSFWGNSEKLKVGCTDRVVEEGSAVQYA